MKLAERLTELRLSKGLNKKEFASLCGIQATTMANYYKGTSEPSLQTVEAIAKVLDVSPAWLVGWDDAAIESRSKTIIIEKIVYVENTSARVPNDWKSNQDGQLIKWKDGRR
ncbi:helix-turn-helix domain-containing protein [Streptococcus catagoni]|uniref:helix-turn-helix domain-containing protein n=1 Tax=Streptococcus catagoni TaxID=2654874 RepID=UPI001409CB59|nr:helix-turn-helix transcriptional regulator [Streptococcus catagoni]